MNDILKTLIYFIAMDDYEEIVVDVLKKYLDAHKDEIEQLNMTEEEKINAQIMYNTLRWS